MANTDTPSALYRASLLKQSRKDEQRRFLATFGMLATAIVFGSFLVLIYSEEHKWVADNLYTLVLAVNNSTKIQDIAFNYTRVINDTVMGSLLTEVLPYVKKTELEYSTQPLVNLVINNTVLFFFALGTIILTESSELARYQGARRSPYGRRAALTRFFGSLGVASGVVVSLWVSTANNSTLHRWDYILMCVTVGASGATLFAFIGQAFPEKGDNNDNSRYPFTLDNLFFGGTIIWIAVSIISGVILCKFMAIPETAFIVALQELRGLNKSENLYEDIISPTAWAALKSDVLPYVSEDRMKVSVTTTNIVLSITGLGLTALSFGCSLHSVIFRIGNERSGRKIIPKKRNLSILISMVAGLIVAVALVVVFFVLINTREEESSWYHLMDYYYAFFIVSTSFAITGLIGAAIPCRRGEDAVQIADMEAFGPSLELHALPGQATAVNNPETSLAPVQKNDTII